VTRPVAAGFAEPCFMERGCVAELFRAREGQKRDFYLFIRRFRVSQKS
jgi:hypothetical protein